MIIVFGWTTKEVTVRPLLDTHCYSCRREVTWNFHRVTEWLTSFLIPVLPMRSRYFLLCPVCKDALKLDKQEVIGIKRLAALTHQESQHLHDGLVSRLKSKQLAGMTETQREYWKNRQQ